MLRFYVFSFLKKSCVRDWSFTARTTLECAKGRDIHVGIGTFLRTFNNEVYLGWLLVSQPEWFLSLNNFLWYLLHQGRLIIIINLIIINLIYAFYKISTLIGSQANFHVHKDRSRPQIAWEASRIFLFCHFLPPNVNWNFALIFP